MATAVFSCQMNISSLTTGAGQQMQKYSTEKEHNLDIKLLQ